MQGFVHAREELYDWAAPQIFSPAFWLEKSNPQQGSFLVKKKILSTIIKVVREICELASIWDAEDC